jgi:histidinol-phosphate aminotransferase
VYEGLLKEGVIVRHLASFGMPTCIRVTVGTASENERFVQALKKVLSVLEEW